MFFFASVPRRLAQGEGDFFQCVFFLGGEAALPFYLMERQTAVFGRGWHALTLPPQALIRRRIPSRPIQSSPVPSRPVPRCAALRCSAVCKHQRAGAAAPLPVTRRLSFSEVPPVLRCAAPLAPAEQSLVT